MSRRGVQRIASSAVLLGWGAALLVRPDAVAAAVAGRPTPPSWLVRVLGGRQLVQSVVVLAAPRTAPTAAAVDLVHAASMVAATALAPRYRRAELASAAVAVIAAVATRAGR
jgi:hypothetical protein